MPIKNFLAYLLTPLLLAAQVVGSQAETLLINNARLIDGTGSAPVIASNILIEDGHIASVDDRHEKVAATTVIDAKGLTVMPGLVDMHTHPTFEIRMEIPKLPFPDPESMVSSDAEMEQFIESRLPQRLTRFLQGGVTTVVSAGSYWPYEVEIARRIASEDLAGPRLLLTSPLFTAPGGHPSSGICSSKPWCVDKLSFEVSDEATATQAVRRFATEGAQGIKLVYDSFDKTYYGGPDFDFPRLDPKVIAAIVAESKQVGLPVMAHAKSVNETADVIKAGVDALVHSALMENAEFTTNSGEYLPALVNAHNLSVTTTIRSFHERLAGASDKARSQAQRNFDLVGPSLRAYSDAGVRLMFGTDFDGAGLDPDPADAVRSEARALVAAGFNELEVIAMATGNAESHPMVPASLGTIKAGKIADILVLSEDPLKDITAITRPLIVIKNGRIIIDNRKH